MEEKINLVIQYLKEKEISLDAFYCVSFFAPYVTLQGEMKSETIKSLNIELKIDEDTGYLKGFIELPSYLIDITLT